jgi:rhodanese-related sulfurtransferase
LPNHIDREAVIEQLAGPTPAQLVEALGAPYFADAHLPGAINIPPGLVDALASRLLPQRDAAVIVYCSATCDSSALVARRLEQLGYSNVSVYDGGKEDWVEHGLPVERTP